MSELWEELNEGGAIVDAQIDALKDARAEALAHLDDALHTEIARALRERAETAEAHTALLGDVLGRLLVSLGGIENVALTGPELLMFAEDAIAAGLGAEMERLRGRLAAVTTNYGCEVCAAMFGSPEQQGDYGLCRDHKHELRAENERLRRALQGPE